MRCKDCSRVRGYAYKRSHLVALQQTKISASDPPSSALRAALMTLATLIRLLKALLANARPIDG